MVLYATVWRGELLNAVLKAYITGLFCYHIIVLVVMKHIIMLVTRALVVAIQLANTTVVTNSNGNDTTTTTTTTTAAAAAAATTTTTRIIILYCMRACSHVCPYIGRGGPMFDDKFVYINIVSFDVGCFGYEIHVSRSHLRKGALRPHYYYYYYYYYYYHHHHYYILGEGADV